ncbi:50S ribosomal protein L3 [Eubacteriales bacterium OttesenSCG-928-G02]|nr:50S ribosomal protein L3 [Eubacteriales bacterium OttesenSCG-928-G02]
MKKGMIGRKIGMTQVFDEKGNVTPVTVINLGPCVVVQKKTVAKDGYDAVQLGYSDIEERKLNKPQKTRFLKANVSFKKYLKEFRLDTSADMNVGDVLTADTFEVGESIDVTGMTKGRGFSGVIKRWNAHRLESSHGTGPVHRQVGSMGANSDPSRVFKNKKMAGQYGNEQVTILNLKIIKIDPEKNLIAVKGAVPGARNGIVFVRNTVK